IPQALFSFFFQFTGAMENRQTHTDLVSVRNLDEDQQLQNLVLQNLGQNSGQRILVFIGLFKDDFRWTDNSSSMTRHWSIGEPDGSGACVVHSLSGSNKWADENCDQTRPFICQDVNVMGFKLC
uniref:C-type lectin domain-containing protein n=1 Tax=Cyprinus carpio TaxID=7962 RepID=A0A8C1U3F5_CYPCA